MSENPIPPIETAKQYRATKWVGRGAMLITLIFFFLTVWSVFGVIWFDWRWVISGMVSAFFAYIFYKGTERAVERVAEARPRFEEDK